MTVPPLTTTDFFTYDAIRTLSVSLADFETPGEFFVFVDELASDKRYTRKLPVAFDWSAPLQHGHSDSEAQNAIEVYNAIGNINRVLASDPRLWTYLALMTHRDYMITRWGWKQEENFAEAVARRWIMPQSRARNMVRHGIARLWWVPKLTYDDTLRFPMSQSQDDPFAYSSWILGSEERLKSLFEGLIGRTPAIRWAAMNSLSKAPANMPARFGAVSYTHLTLPTT